MNSTIITTWIRLALLSVLGSVNLGVVRSLHADNVQIRASANWVSPNQFDITVEASIEPGVHIYGLEQSRPIPATKIQFELSDSIVSATPFQTLTPPHRKMHQVLSIELQEHFDRAVWQSRVVIRDNLTTESIRGSVVVQACEDERCFPPETYTFDVQLVVPPDLDSTNNSGSHVANLERANTERLDLVPSTSSSVLDKPQSDVALGRDIAQPSHATYALLVILGVGMASLLLIVRVFPSLVRFRVKSASHPQP